MLKDIWELKPGDLIVNNQLPNNLREILSIEYRTEKIFLKRKHHTDNWDYIPFNSVVHWKEAESLDAVIYKIKKEINGN